MPDDFYNRVHLGLIAEGTANSRAVVPGKVAEVTRVSDGERIVTFEAGIGRRMDGEPVSDGQQPGRPVLSMGGGGWSVLFGLDAGDEALGLAVDRNPERWERDRTVGDAHSLADARPHDVSNVHLLPFTMTATSGPSDPAEDFVISNTRGEVLRLGQGELTISTPGPDPLVVASIGLTATGDIELTVATGKKVIAGDALAEALTKVQQLLTVLTNASNAAISAAGLIVPPAGDSGASAFAAFLGVLSGTLVSAAGTTKLEGT